MANNSSKVDTSSQNDCTQNQESDKKLSSEPAGALPGDRIPTRRLYFVNEVVEWQLTQYIWTGCTQINLRDQIMSNATELIRQIIRKQGLHTIYPGQEESAFGDLLQTAWCQIERTLYKYRARPHCRMCFNYDRPSDSLLYEPEPREYGIKDLKEVIKINKNCPYCGHKFVMVPIIEPSQGRYGGSATILYRGMSKVFNMWSQISRTVILAYIKKEARDRKNSISYVSHLTSKPRPTSDVMIRFLDEAKDMCKYHDDYLTILKSLEYLVHNDDRPHDGIIGKLVQRSGLSRPIVTGFIKFLKLRSLEFTDSPVNRGSEPPKSESRRMSNIDHDEE